MIIIVALILVNSYVLQLTNTLHWNVVSYSVDGRGSKSSTYSMSKPVYVMIPDESTVDKAKELIQQVKDGKTV